MLSVSGENMFDEIREIVELFEGELEGEERLRAAIIKELTKDRPNFNYLLEKIEILFGCTIPRENTHLQ